MTPQPLVSVVLPTHNRERLVVRALTSVLNQTYRNLEVIVVDDGSRDQTEQVIAGIQDNRVRYLRHPVNRGGSAARNTGIHAATGEYLAFQDSDDEWLPEKLATQIPALQAGAYDLCYCQAAYQLPAGRTDLRPRQPFTGGSLLKYLACDGGAMCAPGLVARRQTAVLFDERLTIHQDWDWVLQMHRQTSRVVFVPQPLIRVHLDAPVRTQNATAVSFLKRAQPFLEKYAAELAAAPQILRCLVLMYAWMAHDCGNRQAARALLTEKRVFPTLFRRPRAWKIWLRCLLG